MLINCPKSFDGEFNDNQIRICWPYLYYLGKSYLKKNFVLSLTETSTELSVTFFSLVQVFKIFVHYMYYYSHLIVNLAKNLTQKPKNVTSFLIFFFTHINLSHSDLKSVFLIKHLCGIGQMYSKMDIHEQRVNNCLEAHNAPHRNTHNDTPSCA